MKLQYKDKNTAWTQPIIYPYGNHNSPHDQSG